MKRRSKGDKGFEQIMAKENLRLKTAKQSVVKWLDKALKWNNKKV